MEEKSLTGGKITTDVITPFGITLTAILIGVSLLGCPTEEPFEPHPPGLEILTPVVGAPDLGTGAILIRTEFPSRISIQSTEGTIGTGHSKAGELASIRFQLNGSGEQTESLTVFALSDDGLSESVEISLVTLENFSEIQANDSILSVAAVDQQAVLLGTESIWLTVNTGGSEDLTHLGESTNFQAIAAYEDENAVAFALNDGEVTIHTVLGSSLDPAILYLFNFPNYSHTSESIDRINALYADEALIAAATDKGFALMDLTGGDKPLCRVITSQAATLSELAFDTAMNAVFVDPDNERLIVGGDYLNVSLKSSSDDNGCDPPMRLRETKVVHPPNAEGQPWNVRNIAGTSSFIWIFRDDRITRLDRNFQPNSLWFRDEDVFEIEDEFLPLHIVSQGTTAATEDEVWVVLSDSEGLFGGMARIGLMGVNLWIDQTTTSGLPQSVDVSELSSLVRVASGSNLTTFTEP